ncbi:acyltransferase [Enterobacter sichuanensis]|uniref:acyltransferase n=1 Tax=Enterobacter sichuanensis TaxID=2071710 RepID=UPI00217DDDB1|nr:acyltransferase [Enterobacter sichuanensis]
MKRIHWVDSARFVAILMVVVTHCHDKMKIGNVLVSSLFYSIDRLGVPIFLMISGGLILPGLEKKDPIEFYKKRIPQFLFLIFIYTVFTNMSGLIFEEGRGVIDSLLYSLINLNGIIPSKSGYAAHMWFMYTIIGLYIIAPFLARMLSLCSTRLICLFVGICIVFNYIPYVFSEFFPLFDIGLLKRVGSDFTGGYLIYMVIGYLLINRINIDLKSLHIVIPSVLIIFVGCLFLAYEDVSRNSILGSYHWYSASIFILVMSVSSMLLIKAFMDGDCKAVVSSISKYSFGIYLIHYAVLYAIKPLITTFALQVGEVGAVLLLFVLVMPISYVLVRIIGALPGGKFLTQ